jgi:hypothetical protein
MKFLVRGVDNTVAINDFQQSLVLVGGPSETCTRTMITVHVLALIIKTNSYYVQSLTIVLFYIKYT